MKTGEGKTLVATLPVYLNALAGKGVHVVTVNDYLAKRDAEWMGQIYRLARPERRLSSSTSWTTTQRQEAYRCDVTYGTNNELGFDYLRDNMKFRLEEMVHRPFHYAIVDEVDSILIDEARTPLIISGPTEDNSELYIQVDKLIPALEPEDYEKDEKQKTVTLTESGQEKMEELLRAARPAACRRALRYPQRVAGPPREPGAAGAQTVRARHRLHRQGRQDHHHRRVHRPHDGRQAVLGGAAPGARSQGRRHGPEREPDARLDHIPELFPHVSEARRDDRHGDDRGGGIQRHLQARSHRGPDQQPCIRDDTDDEVYRSTREKFDAVVQQVIECRERQQPVLCRHGQHREIRGAVGAAQEAQDPAQRAERPLSRAGGVHHRAGGPARRGDDRHQHGRPRHRHPARRQSRHAPEGRTRAGRGPGRARAPRRRDPRRDRSGARDRARGRRAVRDRQRAA